MKKLMISFFLIPLNLLASRAQEGGYDEFIRLADSLFGKHDYSNSAQNYSNAFKSNNWLGRVEHRYKAAQAWAKANNADSAFSQLTRIVNVAKFNDVKKLESDSNLTSLHTDKRWQLLIQSTQNNVKNIDVDLKNELEAIYQEDQKYRLKMDTILKEKGHGSKEEDELWQVIGNKDVENCKKVTKILDEHGWLGKDKVGEVGNMTLFLVIQHADLKVQEKYLPMLKDAVKAGNADPGHLAYLEDRIAVRNGKNQIYGTQVKTPEKGKATVYPIEDEAHVDERRRKMGLQPLADYLKYFGIDYKGVAQ